MSKTQEEVLATAIARIMEMTDTEFRALAEEDVREATGKGDPLNPLLHDALRTPPAIQRFYRLLSVLQRSAEGQLAAKGAAHASRMAKLRRRGVKGAEYQDAIAEHENWRAGALRFKTGVEERITEIASLIRELDADSVTEIIREERNDALYRVRVLEDAIRTHREHECGEECSGDFCVADVTLWENVTKERRNSGHQ